MYSEKHSHPRPTPKESLTMKCKSYSKYILLCLAGIAVNFVGVLLATELKLPLYLDAIGPVATAAIGGLLPGITVGFLTNIITSITDSSNLFLRLST